MRKSSTPSRAYVILCDVEASLVHICLSNDGMPMLFGGGAQSQETPRSAAVRELAEESGGRFHCKVSDLIDLQSVKDSLSGHEFHFFYATTFTDKGSCSSGSKEISVCISIEAVSLCNLATNSLNESEFARDLVDTIEKYYRFLKPTLLYKAEEPSGFKYGPFMGNPDWHSRTALLLFAMKILPVLIGKEHLLITNLGKGPPEKDAHQ